MRHRDRLGVLLGRVLGNAGAYDVRPADTADLSDLDCSGRAQDGKAVLHGPLEPLLGREADGTVTDIVGQVAWEPFELTARQCQPRVKGIAAPHAIVRGCGARRRLGVSGVRRVERPRAAVYGAKIRQELPVDRLGANVVDTHQVKPGRLAPASAFGDLRREAHEVVIGH